MRRSSRPGLREAVLCGALTSAAVLLSGCATGTPVQREVVVSGSRFDGVRGETATVVRTVVEGSAGERQELLGATCDVTSSLFETPLVTPARLVVPSFGPQSPELTVACRAGELRGAERVRVTTRWRYPPGAAGYPAVGVFGGTGGRAGIAVGWGGWNGWGYGAPAYPVFDYPDVTVVLRQPIGPQ